VILLIPFLHYEFIQQAKANFHYVFYSYAIRQGVFFLCILLGILVFENLTLKQLVYFQIFSLLVSLPFAHYYAKKLLGFTKIKNFKLVMELWRYGKYVLGTNISSLIYRNTDHFMLASMVSSTAVAYCNVAVRVSNLVDLPSTVAAEALFPKSAEASTKINKDEQLKNLYEKTVGMTLSLVIPISIIILVFPNLIITLLAGEAYIKSASILQVTILYGLLLPFARQFGTLMDSIGRPHQNFYLVFSMAILNFCFNYLFITYYGDIGAAYGTLVTYLFGFVTCQIILKKTLGITMKNIIVNIFHSYYLLFIRIKGKPTNKLVK
jgi:O-antigen/teichoic acid export membrane protein